MCAGIDSGEIASHVLRTGTTLCHRTIDHGEYRMIFHGDLEITSKQLEIYLQPSHTKLLSVVVEVSCFVNTSAAGG